jgi:hypothetical protein
MKGTGRTSQIRHPWHETGARRENLPATDGQYVTVPKHTNKPS